MNKLLADNYKDISLVASRISKNSKELINETYIAIHHLTPPTQKTDFVKWFSKCMVNQNKWKSSSFNKAIKVNDTTFTSDIPTPIEPEPIDINKAKQILQMHEIELFTLHFEHNLSATQIAAMLEKENGTKECYQSYQRLINIMKTKLRKWKQSTL